jgi:hypothetical protein
MAILDLTFRTLGDLVVHEMEPSVGYARKVISLNFTAAGSVPMGTVVAKAAADTTYHRAVVADLTTAGTVFAVVFGDAHSAKATFDIAANTATAAVAFVRDEVILSDYLIKLVNTQFNAAQINTLKGLLEAQGVLVEIAL